MNFQKFFSLQLYLKQDSGVFCQFCEIFAEYLRRAVSNDIIIARFFCKICCSLKCKIKRYQRIFLLKTAKTSSISSNSFLYLRKYLINQNKNYTFLIRKVLSFCDQNLQFVSFQNKKLRIFIFIFFKFNSSLCQNIFHCNIPLTHGFTAIPNLLNCFKCSLRKTTGFKSL